MENFFILFRGLHIATSNHNSAASVTVKDDGYEALKVLSMFDAKDATLLHYKISAKEHQSFDLPASAFGEVGTVLNVHWCSSYMDSTVHVFITCIRHYKKPSIVDIRKHVIGRVALDMYHGSTQAVSERVQRLQNAAQSPIKAMRTAPYISNVPEPSSLLMKMLKRKA